MESWIWGLLIDSFSLFGAWLLTRRKRMGWIVIMVEFAVLWVLFALHYRQWGFFPGIVIHLYVAFMGWKRWGHDEAMT